MKLGGHTVLITGGSNGIGLAMAERFLNAGSEVIICGRRADKLEDAQMKFPKLHTRICDVAKELERIALFKWVEKEFPKLNILVNNAGIQDRFKLTDGHQEWEQHRCEIAINLGAPIHLSILFVPLLQKNKEAAIINVSSGLAFTPMSIAPVYCATKAGIHSFTMSLRYQLSSANIKVIEIVPPAVQTDLGGANLHTFGVPLNEFADAVFKRIEEGELEIGYATSEKGRKASREEIDLIFGQLNDRVRHS